MKFRWNRISWRSLGVTALLMAALSAAMFLPTSQSSNLPAASPAAGTPTRDAQLLFADWAPAPEAVLLFSGDVHGYLEPCGCSERQSGGFARRADLINQLKVDLKWPTAAFDVGGLLNDSRVTYPQSRIKFSIMMDGLNQLGYQGVALGKEELLLGAQELYVEHVNLSAKDDFDIPFLGVNSTLFGTKDLGTPADYRILTIGNKRIAVTAITGNSTRKTLEATGALGDEGELKVEDPRALLPSLIQRMKQESPDLLVLLSHSSMHESLELAKEFPEFQVVVTAGSVEDPRQEPLYVGKTLIVQVGKKGKHAAVVGVFPRNELKLKLLELDMDRFHNDPRMHELMRVYQEKLHQAWPELSSQSIPDPANGQFVGVDQCKSCHQEAYEIWETTNHAHGYESLIEGRYGQKANWISRIYDPECLSCHVTGWDPQRALRHQSGFIDIENTPHLKGQQCENCHGPGSHHVALETSLAQSGGIAGPDILAARGKMRVTLEQARKDVCVRCHDLDNSPNFEFDSYWEMIAH